MISPRTLLDLLRGEGPRSVLLRTAERLQEAWSLRQMLRRGAGLPIPQPALLNELAMRPPLRRGGVPVQWLSRLAEERRLREVASFHDGVLVMGSVMGSRAWRVTRERLHPRLRILEGGFPDVPVVDTMDRERAFVLVVHDLSLISAQPHELAIDARRLVAAQRLMARAAMVIFPSEFLESIYRAVIPPFHSRIIEPGISIAEPSMVEAAVGERAHDRRRIAFVGGATPHKGGALIADVVNAAKSPAEWHLFGGGDGALLRAIRKRTRTRNVRVHGYYRAGSLPKLLARHHIGLAVLPSVVPESFSLVLSECWSAGVPVVAFDHGAVGARIRLHGGGLLTPLAEGAAGLAARIEEFVAGGALQVPRHIPTAAEAAAAHVALYRELGFL